MSAATDETTEDPQLGTPQSEALRPEAPQSEDPRPLWRRTPIRVCAVIGVLALVAGGVFGGMVWRQHTVDTARAEALRAGTSAAAELLSYNHRTLDAAVEQRMGMVTGDFRDRYRQLVTDTVGPAAKARQVVTTSSVVGSSVVDDDGPDQVSLLLFVNQSSEAPGLAQPLLTGSRIVMTLQHVDGRWLTSNLEPV